MKRYIKSSYSEESRQPYNSKEFNSAGRYCSNISYDIISVMNGHDTHYCDDKDVNYVRRVAEEAQNSGGYIMYLCFGVVYPKLKEMELGDPILFYSFSSDEYHRMCQSYISKGGVPRSTIRVIGGSSGSRLMPSDLFIDELQSSLGDAYDISLDRASISISYNGLQISVNPEPDTAKNNVTISNNYLGDIQVWCADIDVTDEGEWTAPVQTVVSLINQGIRQYTKKMNTKKVNTKSKTSSAWSSMMTQLMDEGEEGIDSLYENTSAGSVLLDICGKIDTQSGVWLEPSIQAGMGTIMIYDASTDETVGEVDYQEYNQQVLDLAAASETQTQFANAYRSYLKSLI